MKISNYLCSVRLHNINWRGTQANFVINFAVARTETSTEPYEPTKIQFLQAAVSGTQIFPVLLR
jgi:hypothetical protein